MYRRSNKKMMIALIILGVVLLTSGTIIVSTIIKGRNSNQNPNQNLNDKSGIHNETEKGQSGDKVVTDPNDTENSNTGNLPNDSIEKDSDKKEEDNNKEDKFKDIKVKAIYLTGVSAGTEERLDSVINLAKTTELNAVVIDVKEAGKVNYLSNVPEVNKNKLYTEYYDPDHVIKKLHENDIYVIGRIVCFRDNGLAKKRADLAIKRHDGTIWNEGSMGAWTNPFNEEVWKYNIDIAKEAVEKGFDEIQFDYVRFPTTRKNEVYYGDNLPTRVEAIGNFLKYSTNELKGENKTMISADIFGIVCESRLDGEALGQDLEKVGMDIDYICPMVYPSHYANASNKAMGNGVGQGINGVVFTAPDLKPYEVVYNTLVKAKDRISAVEGYKAGVRPYLQDFTATYLPEGYFQKYGVDQVRQQIQAVYDAGYEEWILWSGTNNYSVGAFNKK